MQEEDQFDCKYASFPLEDEKALLKKKNSNRHIRSLLNYTSCPVE